MTNSTSSFALNFRASVRASRLARVRETMDEIGSGLDGRTCIRSPKEIAFAERQKMKARPPRFYLVHCAHDRPLWTPCSASTCRRSKSEAAAILAKLLATGRL